MYLRRIVLNRFVFNEKVITPLSALRYTQHHPKTLQVVISLGRHNLSNKIHEKCLAKFLPGKLPKTGKFNQRLCKFLTRQFTTESA